MRYWLLISIIKSWPTRLRVMGKNYVILQLYRAPLRILDPPLNLCKNTKNSNKNGWVLYIIGSNVSYSIWWFYHHRENTLKLITRCLPLCLVVNRLYHIWKIIIDWELITEYLSYSIYYTMSHIVSYCTYCIIQAWHTLVQVGATIPLWSHTKHMVHINYTNMHIMVCATIM